MDQQFNVLQRLGRYSGVAVVLSIVAYYGTLAPARILHRHAVARWPCSARARFAPSTIAMAMLSVANHPLAKQCIASNPRSDAICGLVAILSLAGGTISIHEGARAAVIVVLVWIAVLAMGVNTHRHQSFGPFILSDIGALLVSWVMIVDYSRMMEISGFAMLIVAALWDRQLRRRGPVPLPLTNSEQGTG